MTMVTETPDVTFVASDAPWQRELPRRQSRWRRAAARQPPNASWTTP
jgi:hypothetical protein